MTAHRSLRPARAAVSAFAQLPRTGRVGVVVLALGVAVDIAAHGPAPSTEAASLGHILVLVGMLVVLAGVLSAGMGRKGHRPVERGKG